MATTGRAMERADAWPTFMEKLAPKLEKVATAHLQPERLVRVMLAEMARKPKLRQCDGNSIAMSLLLASQLGLEPSSPLGHLYLVPYGRECTPLIGYKGMFELMRRSGAVKRINAVVFYQQELDAGLVQITLEPPSIVHHWTGAEYPDAELAGSYVVVEGLAGELYLETCTRGEIDARRERSKAGKNGPWVTDFPAMARKCAIRKLFQGGKVPVSAEHQERISAALEMDADAAGDYGRAPRPTRAVAGLAAFDLGPSAPEPEVEEQEADHAGG